MFAWEFCQSERQMILRDRLGSLGTSTPTSKPCARKKTTAIDLVRMTSGRRRYFVNVSAGGFSGVVGEKLTFEIKAAWGPLAYVRSAAAALPELQAYRTTMIFDDTRSWPSTFTMSSSRMDNSPAVGSRSRLRRISAMDCSMLCSCRNVPAAEMALLAAQMVLGKHISSDAVPFRRAKKISVRSRPGMWFNADGELVGNQPAALPNYSSRVRFCG